MRSMGDGRKYLMSNKIYSINELTDITDKLKAQGKKIVFTNGCFDIIHAGHVRYLKEAKSYGDILIVGVNSDSSVSSIKKGRPIISQGHRTEILAAFEMVDFITVFDSDKPLNIIKRLRPDVIVKGGDWSKDQIVGSDIVKETYSLPYYKGLSTTNIIDHIINKSKMKNE